MTKLTRTIQTCMAMGLLSAASCNDQHPTTGAIMENRTTLGDGYLESFAEVYQDGTPKAIGLRLTQAAIDSLPPLHNDGATCWDMNGDGILDRDNECSGGHERVVFFPKLKDVPFKWLMFNWQPHGHAPLHVYDQPHFDLHYFIQDYVDRNYIRTGPCATQINCDDFNKAMHDIPSPFYPIGFKNIGGVAGRMGNHLIDMSAPEFNGKTVTQSFAYGQYDGHLSYFEPVVSVPYLKTQPDSCSVIKPPPAMELSGYYPKSYCARYRPDSQDYVLTLEDWEFRQSPTTPAG